MAIATSEKLEKTEAELAAAKAELRDQKAKEAKNDKGKGGWVDSILDDLLASLEDPKKKKRVEEVAKDANAVMFDSADSAVDYLNTAYSYAHGLAQSKDPQDRADAALIVDMAKARFQAQPVEIREAAIAVLYEAAAAEHEARYGHAPSTR